MATKYAFYFLASLVVFANGLGRFVHKSQNNMHVIERIEDKSQFHVANVTSRNPFKTHKVVSQTFVAQSLFFKHL